jgi:GNAT superfamily N-acetyltransferase
MAQYSTNEKYHTAELALVVRDDYQSQGVGRELHYYMTYLAKRKGLLGFTAEVLEDNLPALNLIKKMGFKAVNKEGGAMEMRFTFDEDSHNPSNIPG